MGALAGLTGAAALVNRGLRESSGLPYDAIGGVRHRWQWRGYEIFATELGSGPLVLLVHGIYAGASSFEFRKLAPLLAKHHRVVAFDLLGCGLSEMPDLEYSTELFVEQIVDAIGEFSEGPMTLVASSLGASFAIRAATRAPDRVRDLVTICPAGLAGVLDADPNAAQRAVGLLIRAPLAGETAYNGLVSKPSLAWFLRTMTYADPASVTPEVLEHYYAVAHQPGARFVPSYFVGGMLPCNVATDLPFVEAPILLLWGERASQTNPLRYAQEYVRLAKDAQLVTFPNSGLLPHEEEPEAAAAAIEQFVGTGVEVSAPEATEPEATAPEATAPEATAPEATAPEVSAPEATAPEASASEPSAPEASARDLSKIFKSYDVRGLYPAEIDDGIAYGIGRAFVEQLQLTSLAVGRDMRPSGPALFEALARGATEAGADVIDIGLVSTDALYFAVGKYGYGGGVMITASHNPADYNGMKFTREQAQAISLETGLAQIRDQVESGLYGPPAERRGAVHERDVLADFAAHCLSFVDPKAIKPFKVAIDAGNGMAGLTVPYVFKHLPCEVFPLFFELDGTFPNHPASPIEPANMIDLQKAVLEHGCDLGVAFDGDADRMFIVDEKGGLVGGDMVVALVGLNTLKRYPGSTILYNLICSRSVPEVLEKAGGLPRRSPVGHSLIKKIMRDENIVFGGEHSGHFYFRDNWFADSGMIALLQCLEVFSDAGKPVSETIAPIDTRFRSGEINSRVHDIPAKLEELQERYADAHIDHLDGVTIQYPDWWMNVRPSNTEPLLRLNVEGDTKELMEHRRDEALAVIRG